VVSLTPELAPLLEPLRILKGRASSPRVGAYLIRRLERIECGAACCWFGPIVALGAHDIPDHVTPVHDPRLRNCWRH
jgi:hypothetical protein